MNVKISDKITYKKHYALLIIFFASLGGILYGYDIGVISGALLFIRNTIPITEHQTGVIVGAVLFGGLIGTLITGQLTDKFGRKIINLFSCLIFILGIIFILFAKSFASLLCARLLLGVGIGSIIVNTPLYISEIAPTAIRGRSMAFFQLLIAFGILLAYFLNLVFTISQNWRAIFGITLIPATILFFSTMFLPETPRWLIAKRQHIKAKAILLKTRHHVEAQDEFNQIQESMHSANANTWKDLFVKRLSFPLFIALIITICNQFTGIQVLLQYSPLVIQEIGLDSHFSTMIGTIGIGFVNFLGTFFAMFLIDRIGRKRLLVIGSLGIILAYIYLGFLPHFTETSKLQAELSLLGLFVSTLFFAIGPATVMWLLITELFPTEIRGKAIALCLFLNSLVASLLSTMFLSIEHSLGMGNIYWLFVIFTIIYFLTALFLVPETKGKTLEEIQLFLNKN